MPSFDFIFVSDYNYQIKRPVAHHNSNYVMVYLYERVYSIVIKSFNNI